MQVILPLAGLGTRLRPHTYSKPKPLVTVAGKTVLGHVLDGLAGLPVDEVIFITGHLGDQIERYVKERYSFKARYLVQRELRGQAHALDLASPFIDRPVLIVFVDTIVKADLARLVEAPGDGVLYVKEVEDPRRFGVAVLEGGVVSRLVEKPKQPISNLAVIGVYYLKNWELLKRSLREVIERDIQTGGEYYLADALQLMIDAGATFRAWPVDAWEDCGTVEALLHANRYLLDNGHEQEPATTAHSVIVPPVHIAPTAKIEHSVVGPHVSVAAGAAILDSVVTDSIVGEDASISGVALTSSLVGSNAVVRSSHRRLNVGDSSVVELG